ncbi:MAG: hypothetical protein J4F40_04665 [Alphaproteobacteria bacterium]|nr:hypothetical protein [Alphaproteobacteria bacterium]
MSERIARLRIELQELEPRIWRRIDMPLSATLETLHEAIQMTMVPLSSISLLSSWTVSSTSMILGPSMEVCSWAGANGGATSSCLTRGRPLRSALAAASPFAATNMGLMADTAPSVPPAFRT